MSARTAIEWTRGADGSAGATWTPIRARHKLNGKVGLHCEHASPGCANCYSEAFNRDRLGTRLPFKPGHRDDVDMERFASADGFKAEGYAALDMCAFWFAPYGRGLEEIDFRGVVIAWDERAVRPASESGMLDEVAHSAGVYLMPQLILGRRYRRRDGAISEPIENNSFGSCRDTYPFRAGKHSYTADGQLWANGAESPADLIVPFPRRTPAAEKAICDVTLEDYRRGVRAVMGGGSS